MIYVYKCDECGDELEREFPMGDAPQFIRSDCDRNGKMSVRANRVFLPLQHRWKDPRPHSEAIIEGARAIKDSGQFEIETTIT